MAFEEIVAGPLSVRIAPVGTAFPTLNETPSADWTLLGTNGDANYSDDGVEVMHEVTFNKVRTQAIAPVKGLIESEDLMIRLTLVDISIEQYAVALNNNAVTTAAAGVGTMGQKRVGLSRGANTVQEFALIARGVSPEDATLPLQFCVPRVFNAANAQPVFRRGQPARLALSLEALHDPSAASEETRFGYFEYGTAPALPS